MFLRYVTRSLLPMPQLCSSFIPPLINYDTVAQSVFVNIQGETDFFCFDTLVNHKATIRRMQWIENIVFRDIPL